MPQILQYNGSVVRNLTGAYGIDNCVPENIKDGVTIAGVTGNYTGGDTPDLSSLTWAQIKSYVDSGNAPAKWVGQYKEIESGTYQGYHFQCVDLYNDRYEKTDGTGYSKAVFMLKELTSDTYMMNSSRTYWKDTTLRTTLNSTFISVLPQNIQDIISEIKLPTNDSSNTFSTTNDKLFLPSYYEMFGVCAQGTTLNYNYPVLLNEGQPQFGYYTYSNNANRIKNDNNTARTYWTRTTSRYNDNNFMTVYADGTHSSSWYTTSLRIAPCFAI